MFDEALGKIWYNGEKTVETCRWVFEMKEDGKGDFLSLDIFFYSNGDISNSLVLPNGFGKYPVVMWKVF